MIELETLLTNDVAASALSNAGWDPMRHVGLDQWEDWYSREGYAPNDVVRSLLTSLGGLTLAPPRHEAAEFSSGTVVVEPSLASGERERIAIREEQLQEALWPVGEWADTYILLVGGSGALDAEAPEYGVLRLGSDVVEGLLLLLTSRGALDTVVPAGE